jgi:hypothetical protein
MRGLIGDLCIKTYWLTRTLRKPVRSLEKTFLDSYNGLPLTLPPPVEREMIGFLKTK